VTGRQAMKVQRSDVLGKLFQVRAAATGKARSPMVDSFSAVDDQR